MIGFNVGPALSGGIGSASSELTTNMLTRGSSCASMSNGVCGAGGRDAPSLVRICNRGKVRSCSLVRATILFNRAGALTSKRSKHPLRLCVMGGLTVRAITTTASLTRPVVPELVIESVRPLPHVK